MKKLAQALLILLLLFFAGIVWLWPRYPYLPEASSPWQAQRLSTLPIISDVAGEGGYININGPSVIRVPDWVENPMGAYYLYFAHHKGSYIRLAYADDPAGPWMLHENGVLPIADSGFPTSIAEVTAGGFIPRRKPHRSI